MTQDEMKDYLAGLSDEELQEKRDVAAFDLEMASLTQPGPDVEDNCQPGVEDYDYGGRRERFGNNRKKVKRSVKRKRAAIAKLSRRRNRR